MTLITRVSRLFKADVHGILDALEEPEAILKQAVREMEDEIEKSRLHKKKLDKQIERFGTVKKNLISKLESTEQKIDYTFSENNEVLIKSLLRKKLEINLQIETMENRLRQLNDEKTELETELKEQSDKLKSIIEKLNLFSDQPAYRQNNGIDEYTKLDAFSAVTQEDVELAFLHEKKRRTEETKQCDETGETK